MVDAETEYPIEGAAVTIRWYENHDSMGSARTRTIDVNQGLSDAEGNFKFHQRQHKNYVMGIYKAIKPLSKRWRNNLGEE